MENTLQFTIGVDVGGTKIAYGLFDADKNIIARHKIDTPLDLSADDLLALIARIALDLPATVGLDVANLAAIGLGFPSMIDVRTGYIILTPSIPQLRDVEAKSILQAYFEVPVTIGNDAHCGALAEHAYGAGRGHDNMLYIPFSTGIASAIIMDGQLHRGAFGSAGEGGHMIITPGEGLFCGCGNQGCFMSYTSGRYIVKHIQAWLAAGETSVMLDMAGGDPSRINGRILEDAWHAGDAMAARAIEQMVRYMGVWLFNLYIVFNVDCFVFGGGLVNLGEPYFSKLRAEFDRYLAATPRGKIYFKPAELKSDFGLIGAEQLIYLEH